MKKLLIFFICLSCLFLSCATNGNNKYYGEYKGNTITKISFLTVNYNGGERREHVLDFDENTYSYANYFRGDEIVFDEKNTFDDEQEKTFIDACNYFGLFKLKESYSKDGVVDGGSWTLTIRYEDGSTKVSEGVNERPDRVFEKCSTYFYDICKTDVLGCTPREHYTPPSLSIGLSAVNTSVYECPRVQMADFKWNTTSSSGNDLFLLNEQTKDKNDFREGVTYILVLYTSNYSSYTNYKKFQKITVTEYDYNQELTGEREVLSSKWFKEIEFELKLNKIYVYELTFKNGDYVKYTFNTVCE